MERFPFARRLCTRGFAALALGYLSGCASISVQNSRVNGSQPHSPPKKIYVMDFDTKDAPFRVNENPVKTRAIKVRTASELSDTVVKRLDKYVVPAERVPTGQFPKADGWLLCGRFDKANSGSATLRILLGAGAGGSKMNTTVSLYDLKRRDRKPFLTFTTTGGSGAMPGLITIPLGGPVALPLLIYDVGSKVYGEENHGVRDDEARTGRMITAALSEYMAHRGFPLKGKVLKAKRDWTSSLDVPTLGN